MDNLVDLYERLNESSMDEDVRFFIKEAIEIVVTGKPASHLEKLLDEIGSEEDE